VTISYTGCPAYAAHLYCPTKKKLPRNCPAYAAQQKKKLPRNCPAYKNNKTDETRMINKKDHKKVEIRKICNLRVEICKDI
jgi:hypothetical protein